MTCTSCGRPLTLDSVHRLEDTKGRTIGTYCRDHCPRCSPVDRSVLTIPSSNGHSR